MDRSQFKNQLSPPCPYSAATRKRNYSQSKKNPQKCPNELTQVSVRPMKRHVKRLSVANPETTASKYSKSSFTASMNHSQRCQPAGGPQPQRKLKIRKEETRDRIKPITRVILVDWLMQTAATLQLPKQTLHDALFFFDQVESAGFLAKQDYQIYGLCCLVTAHKLESSKTINSQTLLLYVAETVTTADLKRVQVSILTTLKFKMTPFTLWREMCLLMSAWQAFSSHWLPLSDGSSVRKGLEWMTDALGMMYSPCRYPFDQRLLCLGILHNELKFQIKGSKGWQYTFQTFICSIMGPQFSKATLQTINHQLELIRAKRGEIYKEYDPQMKAALAKLVVSM